MRLLAFSDLHRDQAAARAIVDASGDADILVGAGDFGTRGDGAADTLSILADCGKPVVVVHGNHDDPAEVAAVCAASATLRYLHGDAATVNGVAFFGLGGEIPSRNAFPWNAAETESDAAALLARCARGAVLATHTPPYGLADLQRDGAHEGSASIRNCVEAAAPRLALCGHIHHAWGMRAQCGSTPVANLGPTINWFEI